jgi:hypothetical protein
MCELYRLPAGLSSSVLEMGEKASQDPLGHPPHNPCLHFISLNLTGLAGDLEAYRVVNFWP